MKANDRFPRIARLAPSSEQDEHRRSATGERSPRCGDGRSTSAPAHVSARHSATTDQVSIPCVILLFVQGRIINDQTYKVLKIASCLKCGDLRHLQHYYNSIDVKESTTYF
jgi:hypothetical protein